MNNFVRVWHNFIYVDPRYDVGVLELSHPDGRNFTHLFDSDCLDFVHAHHWSPLRQGGSGLKYTRTYLGHNKFMLLHHLPFYLRGITIPRQVDHLNRNSYDSRFANLRLATPRQNILNSSSTRGVPHMNPYSKDGGFRVGIHFAGKRTYSPVIDNEQLAIKLAGVYSQLGVLFDEGRIPRPTTEQMRKIVDYVKAQPLEEEFVLQELFPKWSKRSDV